jgi:hypothetical protein
MQTRTILPQVLAPLMLRPSELEHPLTSALSTEPTLYVRQRSLMRKSVERHLPLQYLGTMRLFEGHRVYPGRDHDWVLVNLADDPLFRDRDGFPVPRQVLRELRAIKAHRVDFDALYVAHQVRPGRVQEGAQLTADLLLPPPPAAVQKLSDRLGAVGQILWLLAWLPMTLSSAIAGAALAGATTLVTEQGLDPLLLGVLVGWDRPAMPGELAAWFYLSHWVYNAGA